MDELSDVDVVIIGAGAAGLAAAHALRQAGMSLAILEARGRVGGRIYTYRDQRVPVPIELGAEFVHGEAPETTEIVREARLTAYDVLGDRWRAQRGSLKRVNRWWKRMDRVMGGLDPQRTPDQSFADYLATHLRKPKYARDRQLAAEFVQGFHAADVTRISERALAQGGNPGDDPTEMRTGRVLEGYDRVMAWLALDVLDAVMFNTVVERVTWSRGHVAVEARSAHGDTVTVRARTAIVTIPLGVLQAPAGELGAIEFVPDVEHVRTVASHLAMGSVMRITYAFHEAFWTNTRRRSPKGKSLAQMSFLHGRDTDFPVWWTLFPLRLPVMVAWCGGPPAQALSQESDTELRERGISALAQHLGVSRERVDALVEGCWLHNWERDPFSRGAYTYPLVGGSTAAARLAHPVEDTLFFAGEATATDGENGTVEGALTSGRKAAQNVLASLPLL